MEAGVTTIEKVKNYYGRVLGSQKDLKTTACCANESLPRFVKNILVDIEGEILDKFYGCGSPIPLELKGKTVLDLGCGTGRDVYIASALVGMQGRVIGVDMTEEQLQVARKHQESQRLKFGHPRSNVQFIQGYNEALVDIPDASVDVVISNCVINLSPDKGSVFQEVFRVLRPGGEFYFSDVFSDRRVPQPLQEDPVLYGECLSGAIYVEDLRRLFLDAGCADFRTLSSREIEITEEKIKNKLEAIKFYSNTVRAFKIDSLEDRCEDYGQVATYLGTMEHAPGFFNLDDHHLFEKGRPVLVCGNTADMLSQTRYGKHFQITGDRSVHYGLFDCAPARGTQTTTNSPGGAACC